MSYSTLVLYEATCTTHTLSHTDGLANRVRIVGDLQMRQMLADFLGHLLWSEAHGSDIVRAQGQLALWSLHEFYCGTVAVRDMHHGKTGVGSQVALVMTCAESIVEDLNRVVCEERNPKSLVHCNPSDCAEYTWCGCLDTSCSSSRRCVD